MQCRATFTMLVLMTLSSISAKYVSVERQDGFTSTVFWGVAEALTLLGPDTPAVRPFRGINKESLEGFFLACVLVRARWGGQRGALSKIYSNM